MKCPICGAEAPFNSNACPSCGYTFTQNNSQQMNNSPAGYGQTNQWQGVRGNQFNSNGNFGYQNAQVPQRSQSSAKGIALVVICVFLLLVVYGIYKFSGENKPKTFEFSNFSVTLPGNLKKVNDSKFTSALSASSVFDKASAEEYKSSTIRFAYCVTRDYSDQVDNDKELKMIDAMLKPSTLISSLSTSYKSKSGYDEIEKTEDSLRFIVSDGSTDVYTHIKVYVVDHRMYILFLVCNQSNQKKYEDKFIDWMNSFKVN